MGTYTKIKSEFIKKKLKKADWKKHRDYIDNLIFLERSITEGINGWAGNMMLNGLKSSYEKEYNEIFKELDPKRFEKYLKQKKKEDGKEKRENEEMDKEEKEEEIKDKKDWIKAGGRLNK